jgi:hypothetical protein
MSLLSVMSPFRIADYGEAFESAEAPTHYMQVPPSTGGAIQSTCSQLITPSTTKKRSPCVCGKLAGGLSHLEHLSREVGSTVARERAFRLSLRLKHRPRKAKLNKNGAPKAGTKLFFRLGCLIVARTFVNRVSGPQSTYVDIE